MLREKDDTIIGDWMTADWENETARTPEDSFENHRDVLDCDDLSDKDKLGILYRLRSDIRESEGGDERLADIDLAIKHLQADAKYEPSRPEGAPLAKVTDRANSVC